MPSDALEQQALQIVVRITDKPEGPSGFTGTGFLVSTSGHVVTCQHVVQGAEDIWVHLPYTKPWRYRVHTKLDGNDDLVLLKGVVSPTVPTACAAIHPNWAADTRLGDAVTAWGCSSSQHYDSPQRFGCTISGFTEQHGYLGLNGDINPGDSGGPLINRHGQVIGVVRLKDRARNGQAMAIPASTLLTLLEQSGLLPDVRTPADFAAAIVIPAVSDKFVGRDGALKNVLKELSRNRIVTITGLGGIGKTELAKAVGHAARGEPWAAEGVFYIDLQSAVDATAVVSSIVMRTNADHAAEYSSLAPQFCGQRLYILDDLYPSLVNDRKRTQEFVRALHDYADPARFLLTSRELISIPGMETVVPLERLMPPADKILFEKLADSYGYHFQPADAVPLQFLLKKLEGYPLGLTIAASLAHSASLSAIVKSWKNRHTAALKIRGIAHKDLDHLSSVDYSLALSVDDLPDEEAKSVFTIFAYLPGGATEDMVEAIAGESSTDGLYVLVQRSLVYKHQGRYEMLAPVREFANRALTNAHLSYREKLDKYLLDLVCQWCHDDDYWIPRRFEALNILAAEMPNIHAALDRAKERRDDQFVAELTDAFRRFYEFAFAGVEGLQRLLEGVAAARVVGDHVREVNCLVIIGDIHQVLGEHEQSRAQFNKAITLCERHENVQGRAHAISGLADADRLLGNYSSAQDGYRLALSLYEEVGGTRGKANSIKGLGDVHLALNKFRAAREYYQDALKIYESISDTPCAANCVHRLGEVDFALENYSIARTGYAKALVLYQQMGSKLGEANCMLRLGEAHQNLKDYPEARLHTETALRLYRAIGHQLGEANCLQSLGDVHWNMHEDQAGEEKFNDALAIYRQLGNKLGQANCLQKRGRNAAVLRNFEDARAKYMEALELYEATNTTRGRANCLDGLAELDLQTFKYSNACEKLAIAVSLYESIDSVWGLANSLRNLSYAYMMVGDFPNAGAACERSRTLYDDLHAGLSVALALERLGDIHRLQGDLEKAHDILRQAQDHFRRLENESGEATCKQTLANLHVARGEYGVGMVLINEALEYWNTHGHGLGEANCLQRLGEISVQAGDLTVAQRHLEAALNAFQRMENKMGEASSLTGLGELFLAAGNLTESRRRFEQALLQQRELCHAYNTAETLESFGKLLKAEGRLPEALSYTLEAIELFQQSGDTSSIKRARLQIAEFTSS